MYETIQPIHYPFLFIRKYYRNLSIFILINTVSVRVCRIRSFLYDVLFHWQNLLNLTVPIYLFLKNKPLNRKIKNVKKFKNSLFFIMGINLLLWNRWNYLIKVWLDGLDSDRIEKIWKHLKIKMISKEAHFLYESIYYSICQIHYCFFLVIYLSLCLFDCFCVYRRVKRTVWTFQTKYI